MRVLMMTQVLDRHDQVLSFTHDWVEALAARVEHLIVVPVSADDYSVPQNVTVESMGKERGEGRAGRARTFYSVLNRHIREVDVLFAHMSPRYVLSAAPLAATHRKPITLWYTHRQASPELRLAVPLVRHIATAHPTSFPIPGPKVSALGHGVNTGVFRPDDSLPDDPPLVISLARLSPIKRHETLIRAAALLRDRYGDPPARFVIAGGTLPGQPDGYAAFLEDEVERLRLGDRVTLWGAIPSEAVPGVFSEASLAFNGSPPGLFDKSALESMLCALPTVVANTAFADIMGEYAPQLCIQNGEDAEALAEKLNGLLRLSREERRAMGMTLSQRTAAAHSLDQLMDRLVALMAS
ncbi:MAG: glycosyltransferase family 4 protein [Anaerolineae bacterium]|nr:glycosyltransferase family 4 protein [Anaerolineae bacterium]